MKIYHLKDNLIEIEHEGKVMLFSYQTLVGVFIPETNQRFISSKFHSRTTTRHIKFWLQDCMLGLPYKAISQSELEEMIK